MKKIILCFAILLLSSCSNKKIENIEIERRAPDIAMQKCQTINEIKDGSFKSVVLKLQEVIGLYNICEEKRQSLQDFINKK